MNYDNNYKNISGNVSEKISEDDKGNGLFTDIARKMIPEKKLGF